MSNRVWIIDLKNNSPLVKMDQLWGGSFDTWEVGLNKQYYAYVFH